MLESRRQICIQEYEIYGVLLIAECINLPSIMAIDFVGHVESSFLF